MSKRYPVPRRSRGRLIGDLLQWLVGVLTLVGVVVLWVHEDPVSAPETLGEIRARIAPVGRVALAETLSEVAGMSQPLVGPRGEDKLAGSAPVDRALDAETAALDIPSVIEAPTGGVSTALESLAGETAPAPQPAPWLAGTQLAAHQPRGVRIDAGDSATSDSSTDGGTAADEPAPLKDTTTPPASLGTHAAAENLAASVGPLPPHAPVTAGAEEASISRGPGPLPWRGPYRLAPLHRPDLPGAPYQLVPVVPMWR